MGKYRPISHFSVYKSQLATHLIEMRKKGHTLDEMEAEIRRIIKKWYSKSGSGKNLNENKKKEATRRIVKHMFNFQILYDPSSEIELAVDTEMGENQFKIVASTRIDAHKKIDFLFLYENTNCALHDHSLTERERDGMMVTLDGPAYFLNHICKWANVEVMPSTFDEEWKIFKTGCRMIQEGQELLWNYGKYFVFEKCQCKECNGKK